MRRVLVVDDNEDIRYLMQVILTAGGYHVEVASDGVEAIAAQQRQAFDLIITDLFMPHQDGIETIATLRKSFPEVRVIAVSGGGRLLASTGYLATALAIGANAALAKPFDPELLLQTVRSVLAAQP
ncbi:MAG: response regulator [Myxococcota bacterium]